MYSNMKIGATHLVALMLGMLPLALAQAANEPASPGVSAAAAAPAPAGATAPTAAAAPAAPELVVSSEEVLRNTVVNILDSLVQKGVLTREQAQAIVENAQSRALASARETAATKAANEVVEKDAVRVTYVPQIVKDDLARQMSAQVSKDAAAQVIAEAKEQGWGVPGALPEWLRTVRLNGDVRVRAEDALYAKDNAVGVYNNYAGINAAGGVGRAGVNAVLNVSQDRPRFVGRFRFGGNAQLTETLSAEFRVASGNISNAVSTNQTLGNYGARWQFGVDRAALRWNPHSDDWDRDYDVHMGRFENPFATYNELLWDQDLSFEGVSGSFNWNRVRGEDERTSRWLFATVGAFPLQEVELSGKDKWLYGAQIGTEIPFTYDSNLRIAGAIYDFANVSGRVNAPGSNLLDYTAPAFMQKGNTLVDIRNDVDTSTNLWALAGKYRLVSGLVQLDMLAFGENHVTINGEFVKNIGWKRADVQALTAGLAVTGSSLDLPLLRARTSGYEFGVTVGRPKFKESGQWRAGLSYRHLERDAVVDAFTDSDFHLGGTDAAGYIFFYDYALGRSVYARMRYLSANQIDGAPLGIDVAQLDLVGQF
jgi:polyhydroxyalkanoate synthesis regulator phasin